MREEDHAVGHPVKAWADQLWADAAARLDRFDQFLFDAFFSHVPSICDDKCQKILYARICVFAYSHEPYNYDFSLI